MPAQIFFQKTLFLPSNSSKIDRLPRPTLQTAVGTRGQVRHPALQTAEACNTECLVISIAVEVDVQVVEVPVQVAHRPPIVLLGDCFSERFDSVKVAFHVFVLCFGMFKDLKDEPGFFHLSGVIGGFPDGPSKECYCKIRAGRR